MADQLTITDSQPLPAQAGSGLSITKSEPLPTSGAGQQLVDLASHTWGALTAPLHAIAHPIDTLSGMLRDTADEIDQGKKAWSEGRHEEAIDHFKNAIPVAGPFVRQLNDEWVNGQYGAMTGDVLGAWLGGKAGAKMVEAAPKVIAAAPDAIKAIPQAASDAATFTKEAVKAGGKDIAAGATKTATGAAAATEGPVGVILGVPKAVQGLKQLIQGTKTGIAAGRRALTPELGAEQGPAMTLGDPEGPWPAQPITMSPSRQIAAPGASYPGQIIPPAPADASGIIPGWQPPRSPDLMAGKVPMPRPRPADFSWPGEMNGPIDVNATAPGARSSPAEQLSANPPVMPQSQGTAAPDWTQKDFQASARTKKATALAHVLNQSGLAADDIRAGLQDPDVAPAVKAHLSAIVKSLKLNQTGQISAQSIDETLFELRKLERAAQPTAQPVAQ
jgi:hypothetical protein